MIMTLSIRCLKLKLYRRNSPTINMKEKCCQECLPKSTKIKSIVEMSFIVEANHFLLALSSLLGSRIWQLTESYDYTESNGLLIACNTQSWCDTISIIIYFLIKTFGFSNACKGVKNVFKLLCYLLWQQRRSPRLWRFPPKFTFYVPQMLDCQNCRYFFLIFLCLYFNLPMLLLLGFKCHHNCSQRLHQPNPQTPNMLSYNLLFSWNCSSG